MRLKRLFLLCVLIYSGFSFSQSLSPDKVANVIAKNEKFGDNYKIPFYSSFAIGFVDEGYHFLKKDNKWGIVNSNKDKIIMPFEIDSVISKFIPINVKQYLIKQKDVWKCVTFNKKYKIKDCVPSGGISWEDASSIGVSKEDFLNRQFEVIYNGKQGLMNNKFEIILPFEYDYIQELIDIGSKSDSYLLYKDSKVGLLVDGYFIEPKYDFISTTFYRSNGYKGNLITIDEFLTPKLNGKFGAITLENKIIIPFEFEEIVYCENLMDIEKAHSNKFVVKKDNKFGVISDKGEELLSVKYASIKYVDTYEKREDVFIVEKNGKYGVINSNKEIIIPLVYDSYDPDETSLTTFKFYNDDGEFIVNLEI